MNLKIQFPPASKHDHPQIKNVNEIIDSRLTFGQKASDFVAKVVGSWKFIIIQSCILTVWVILNISALILHWDPYPFILMNLVLSLQAAYTAPVIMMSQNRQAQRDRLEAHNDFLVDTKAEEEIRTILEHLEEQNKVLMHLYKYTEINNGKINPEEK